MNTTNETATRALETFANDPVLWAFAATIILLITILVTTWVVNRSWLQVSNRKFRELRKRR